MFEVLARARLLDPGADPEPEALLPLLARVEALPLDRRWPLFEGVARLARHPSAALRAASLRCLGGAVGLPAERLQLEGLQDGDPGVRAAAVVSLRASASHCPHLWAHLVVHPDLDLRRLAARQAPASQHRVWLRLLADPEVRSVVMSRLDEGPIEPAMVLLLLQHARAGHLPARWLGRALQRLPWVERLPEVLLALGPGRPVLLDEIGGRSSAPELAARLAGTEDPLDLVLAVLLDAGEARATASIFEGLLTALRAGRHPPGSWQRLAQSLIARLLGPGRPLTTPAFALILPCWPALLQLESLSLVQRRAAAAELGDPGAARVTLVALESIGARALFLDKGQPRIDVGLALFGVGGASSLALLLSWTTPRAMLAAALRDPQRGARLLGRVEGLDAADRAARDQVLAFLGRGNSRELPLLAGLLQQDPDGFQDRLAACLAPEPGLLLDLLRILDEAVAGRSSSGEKAARLAQRLHAALPRPLDRVADLLRRDSLRGPVSLAFLVLSLRDPPPAEVVEALGPDGLSLLCQLDEEQALLPWALATRIAQAVPMPPSPDVAGWMAPLLGIRPRKVPRLPAAASRRPLGAAELVEIAGCADRGLEHAVEVALKGPVSGLVGALATRPLPAQPRPRVLAALLICDDPLDQVAVQLVRFGILEPEPVAEVDRLLVEGFAARPDIGPAGGAWLHRWDPPHDGFAAWLGESPSAFLELLQASLGLPCPPLRAALWRAQRHLLGRWRWRKRGAVLALAEAGLDQVLVAALEDRGGPGRGSLGFPSDAQDRQEVRLAAAEMLAILHGMKVDLEAVRARVGAVLPVLTDPVRAVLQGWVSSRGLPGRPAPSPASPRHDPGAEREIEGSSDLLALRAWCRSPVRGQAELAILRLLELGPSGWQQLLEALIADGAPHRAFLGGAMRSWTDAALLARAERLSQDPAIDAEARFHLALGLAEGAGPPEGAAVCAARLAAGSEGWFDAADLARLLGAWPGDPTDLALLLLPATEPIASGWAVGLLSPLAEAPPIALALAAWLHQDLGRSEAQELQVALALRAVGNDAGLPVLLSGLLGRAVARPTDAEARTWALGLGEAALVEAAQSALLGGDLLAPGRALVEGLLATGVDPVGRNDACARILADARSDLVQTMALRGLHTGPTRSRAARAVAEVFLWGRDQGRRLLARTFHIRMIAGPELGWTRLTEEVIQVNPLPILRQERDARALVRGLIVHELGHHLYNADAEGLRVNEEAARKGLARLHNLVCDEHLERNLRSRDPRYGDDLKRLSAWAFQHARREIEVVELFDRIGPTGLPALVATGLGAARAEDKVSVVLGQMLRSLERGEAEETGGSFARFFRALRMGLGDRHGDPKVQRALALFDRGFRHLDNPGLLRVTEALKAIFGAEVALLDLCDLHVTAAGGEGEGIAHGRGLSDQEVQDAVEGLERRRAEPGAGRSEGSGPDQINRGSQAEFKRITQVKVLPYDPDEAAKLARDVLRPARLLRAAIERLGLRIETVRPRSSGHRLDRGRILALAIRRDPRALVARQRTFRTDLFIGLVVDCSGSMTGPRIERARRFAALVAEACRDLPGVDLRLFGFTDQWIYDAGDARRPAAPALEAGGGNNDAAALWYLAQVARRSRRSARLLVMVSDGLPTECTVTALRTLVQELEHRHGMVCAQVAVEHLSERCFPTTVEILDQDADQAVRAFGRAIHPLVTRALSSAR